MQRSFAIVSLAILTVGLAFLVNGCGDEEISPIDDVTYPAAYVVNGGSNSVSVIDLATLEVRRTIGLPDVQWPHHINLDAGGDRFAVGVPGMDLSGGHGRMMGMMGMMLVMDARSGRVKRSVKLSSMNHNAAFSPDGTEIWTSQMDSMGVVLVLDAENLVPTDTIEVGSLPAEVTFSVDGARAFVANGMSGSVSAIDVLGKTVVATISVGDNPVGAWPGLDGKMYVDNEEGETVSVIDVETLMVEETVPLGFMPGMAAYNAPHDELWVTDAGGGRAVYFQRTAGQWSRMGDIATGAGAHGITFTADGSRAYVTNQHAGTVSVLSVTDRTKIADIVVGANPNGVALRETKPGIDGEIRVSWDHRR